MVSVDVQSFEFGRDRTGSKFDIPTRSYVCNVFPSFVPKVSPQYLGGCSIPIKFEICDFNCLCNGCDWIDCGS